MKKFVLGLVLGIIFCASSVYAVTKLKAEEVSYNDKTVKDAIDDLYTRALISGDCVQGKFQLTENANTSIGDKILDFSPSMFYLSCYNKNLPFPGENWNGGTIYYNKNYSEDTVFGNDLVGAWTTSYNTLTNIFSVEDGLVIKNMNNAWANQVIDYVACK